MSSASTPAPRLSVSEKVAYGLGDMASNFYFQVFNIFLFYYYTDIFGIPAAAVGTMMLFTRVLDAVMDPVFGILADRTQTRWGKFRPYILWGALPYGVLGYLMFANPQLSQGGKLIFAYVTYSLMWVAYTAINIPYSALMGVMSSSSDDRSSLSGYRFACAFSGGFLINLCVVPLKDFLGGGNEANGFRNTMAIFAVISVGMFLYTFLKSKERVQPPKDQDGSLTRDVSALAKNTPWVVLFVVAFLTLTNVGIRNAAGIYYFKYVVGSEKQVPIFGTLGSLMFIAGAMGANWLRQFFSRRSLMIWLTLINAVAILAFYVVDPKNIILLHALNIIASLAAGPTPAIVWSFYADAADFGEWKFGRRTTGLAFSAAVFAQKVGLAVGSWMLGMVLTSFGFVANAVQTPGAIQGIKLAYCVIPGVFAVLSGLGVIFYRLDDPTMKTVETDLASRKAIELEVVVEDLMLDETRDGRKARSSRP